MGILTLVIFFVGLYYLRNGKKENLQIESSGAAEISSNYTSGLLTGNELKDFSVQEIKITSLASGLEIGLATRGIENKFLYHTAKVSLPVINRESEFYEGWLVRQSPFDFFSTGEMITNDLGEFVLEWAGMYDDILSYNNLVITREARDNNPAPSEHVAEGKW